MEQINKIELRGIVGNIRTRSVNSKQVMNISVATDFVYKGSGGEPVIETTWHNVTVWEGKGMPDFSSIRKGSKIYVCGRLRSQRYTDNDGVDKSSYEVLANKLNIIREDTPLQYEM